MLEYTPKSYDQNLGKITMSKKVLTGGGKLAGRQIEMPRVMADSLGDREKDFVVILPGKSLVLRSLRDLRQAGLGGYSCAFVRKLG